MPLNPHVQQYLGMAGAAEAAPTTSLLNAQQKVAAKAAEAWQSKLNAAMSRTQGRVSYGPGTWVGGGRGSGTAAEKWYRDAGMPWPSGGGGEPYVKGGGDLIGRIMQTIGTKESGNNYNAQNKYGSARGRYQFISSTWQGLNKRFGGNAGDWSPQNQDNIARKYISSILAANNNDVLSIAPTWYVGHYNPNNLDYLPSPEYGNTMTVRKYRDKWMEYFNQT